MEKEKNKNGVIILLLVLVIILAVLCVLFATGTINLKSDSVNNNQNTNDATNVTETPKNTISSITGMYSAKFENLKGDVDTASITLNLYDNGVFTYVFSQYAPVGTLGNYFVDGDKIILKYWFNSDSGTGLHVTGGSKVLTINSDGSIVDSTIKVKSLIDNDITSITLVSASGFTAFDLSNRLGTAFFTEADHTVSDPAT